MWNQICDDAHEADIMTLMNRVFVAVAVCFLSFGAYAITTRFGAAAPPTSVAYGTEAAPADAAVFGD